MAKPETEKKEIKSTSAGEPPLSPDGEGEKYPDEVIIPILGIRLPRAIFPWLIIALFSALLLGWSFLTSLPPMWFDEEGYYSHGILVPFMTLAVIYMRRDQIRKQPIGSSWLGFAVMLIGLGMVLEGRSIGNMSISGFGFILSLIGGVYFAFGKHIGRICLAPFLFLIFMMPFLGYIIDLTTNRLQIMSTVVASKMLSLVGFQNMIPDGFPTLILMDHYELNIGGPCSGFKLILSLTAFTTFFVMISSLGLWKDIFLFAITIPLALLINGLRIMLIGIVGEYGTINPGAWWAVKMRELGKNSDVGLVFHDYSGYITLIVCFIILHYTVKLLERRPSVAPAS